MLIVKLICLVLGTALTALFILFALRGRKEDWRIEGVPQKEFSDKELWAAGFAMQQLPVFSMDSAVGKKMMSASAILHPENGGRFVEYWARLYWARTLSMSLLVLALAFCASVFMDGYMVFVVLIAGVAMVAVTYSNGANEMSNQLKKRSEECMMEFSNVVSKLTLLMNCGMILKEAWYIVAKSKKGVIYDLMQEACRETTKGTPTMAYLNGILMRQHQLGRHEAIALETGMQSEHEARGFAREVYAGLGVTGKTPTRDDLDAIETWHEQGAGNELILLAVKAAHSRSGGGNMDDVDSYLQDWRRRGLTTADAVRADSARTRMLNGQLREIYAAAGMEKRPNAPDRDLLCRWVGEMGMTQELILLAAEYARGAGSPMMLIGRILRDWSREGIATTEAARQEHESHVQSIAQKTPTLPTAQKQDTMLRYTPEERRATYSAAVVNFDEEDDGQ